MSKKFKPSIAQIQITINGRVLGVNVHYEDIKPGDTISNISLAYPKNKKEEDEMFNWVCGWEEK